MIKIQKKDFNIDLETKIIKDQHSNIGAVTLFIGYVKDFNNNKDVKYIDLDVYNEMAINELSKIRDRAISSWNLIDCLIIHRYGKLFVNDKIVLVACFSKNRANSLKACEFIMDFLKKDAPFWKNEHYKDSSKWLENSK